MRYYAPGESLSLAGKASGPVKTSSSGKKASGSSNEIVLLQKDMWCQSQSICYKKPYMCSRRNGGMARKCAGKP